MLTVPAGLLYAQIDASTAELAALADAADPGLPIPACPEWTLRQLITHVGRAHRWAAEIVGTRSPEFIEFSAVPDGKLPDDPAAAGRWLTAGAAKLVATLQDAGEEEVWTFSGIVPAGFWARRMAHETTVHCADGLLAAGDDVSIPPVIAADAIDEWLTFMSWLVEPDKRLGALPPGRAMHVRAIDPELDGTGEWLVLRSSDGIQVGPGPCSGDVAIAGRAADLLLVLMRRKRLDESQVRASGEASLLDQWLEHTAF